MLKTKQPNKYGGGSKTNVNGLRFEQSTSLNTILGETGYSVSNNLVSYKDQIIGWSVSKRKLYSVFFGPKGINYKDYNSKRWEPDECFINELNRTVYIIEKKFQNSSGSVDEKLPGCHFKKLEYEKLFTLVDYKVEFIYVFNDWFQRDEYRDTRDYILDMGCLYFFNQIPLDAIGLEKST